jgi:hypothetical protein
MNKAAERIKQAVLAWEHTEAHPHRFGGTEYRIGKRELGHVHGNVLVDIPFPKRVRDELIASGEAEPHHILPDSGWVSFYIREGKGCGAGVEQLSRSYQLALKQRQI